MASSATEESRKLFSVEWDGRIKRTVMDMAEKDSISLNGTAEVHITSPQTQISGEIFSNEWAQRVKDKLLPATEEGKLAKDAPPLHEGKLAMDAPPLHVPELLRSSNPSAYDPHFISFGPYHYRGNKLEHDYSLGQNDKLIKISAKEAYKLRFAAELSPLRIDISAIESMMPEFEHFYNWPIPEGDYCKNFALMMMVDSLFLIHFLLSHHDHGHHGIFIKCDILKLENQIPLFVVKEIFKKMDEGVFPLSVLKEIFEMVEEGARESIVSKSLLYGSSRAMLQRANKMLSPFLMEESIPAHALVEPHLLGCIHAIASTFLEIETHSRKPTLPQRFSSCLGHCMVKKVCGIFFPLSHLAEEELPIKTYTAVELARTGIKFKSFNRPSWKIRFDNHTLYLPRMSLSNVRTEVFFRNMVALEFVDTPRPDTVTRFIQLMHCLISTPDDVQVLRKSHVISCQCLLTDEDIAGIWDSIRKPFSHGHVDPPRELKSALDEVLKPKYHRIKFRMALLGTCQHYHKQYFSSPWSCLAFLFGLFLVTVSLCQAYCNFRRCRKF